MEFAKPATLTANLAQAALLIVLPAPATKFLHPTILVPQFVPPLTSTTAGYAKPAFLHARHVRELPRHAQAAQVFSTSMAPHVYRHAATDSSRD